MSLKPFSCKWHISCEGSKLHCDKCEMNGAAHQGRMGVGAIQTHRQQQWEWGQIVQVWVAAVKLFSHGFGPWLPFICSWSSHIHFEWINVRNHFPMRDDHFSETAEEKKAKALFLRCTFRHLGSVVIIWLG